MNNIPHYWAATMFTSMGHVGEAQGPWLLA